MTIISFIIYTIFIMLSTVFLIEYLQPDINDRYVILGLWSSQTDGERIIQIRVDNKEINEICHEIGYRKFSDTSEYFAENCKLEDYYNATK